MTAGGLLVGGTFITAITYAGVRALEVWLRARRVLDHPNERSSHSSPVPRGGGVAIVVSVLGAAAVIPIRVPAYRTGAYVLLICTAAVIAAISFFDDLFGLSSRLRLLTHLVAAIVALCAFGPVRAIAFSPARVLEVATVPAAMLTVVWIVGLTNAYNFMDGIDLMAAGQAVAAGIGWVVLGVISRSEPLTILGVAVSCAAAGFAIHNRPPARIFMGDVGSAFLGYLLATTAAFLAARHEPILGICGALLVWPFVFDAAFTFLRRLRKREAVFQAHRSHLYQRLVIAGMSHLSVSATYFALDLLGVGCAAALAVRMPGALPVSVAAISVSAASLWGFVVAQERRAQYRAEQRDAL